MKIAVIYGGYSPESKASEENAAAITGALKQAGHSPEMVEFNERVMGKLGHSFDMAFIATQGKFHGDGTCQSICEHIGIPYTGARAAAASIINDKALCKILCLHHGIPTPPFMEIPSHPYKSWAETKIAAEISKKVGFPAVSKPPAQGGSFGVRYLSAPADVEEVREAFLIDDGAVVEKYVAGSFITASVLEVAGRPIVLPLMTAKNDDDSPLRLFTGGFQASPAVLEPELEKRVAGLTAELYTIFRARGYARIDYIIEKHTNTPYFIEINAVPGLRAKSFFPAAARLAGFELPELCNIIVEEEERRYA